MMEMASTGMIAFRERSRDLTQEVLHKFSMLASVRFRVGVCEGK